MNQQMKEKVKKLILLFIFIYILNLSPRYLLFQIATNEHDVTITHIRPSSNNNTWIKILIFFGIICLFSICFFLGRISKSIKCNFNFARQQPPLIEVPPEFAQQDGIQPNIREPQHQEIQPDNIQSQEQQNL